MSRSWYESSHFTEKMTEVLKDKVTKSGLQGDSGISLVLFKACWADNCSNILGCESHEFIGCCTKRETVASHCFCFEMYLPFIGSISSVSNFKANGLLAMVTCMCRPMYRGTAIISTQLHTFWQLR